MLYCVPSPDLHPIAPYLRPHTSSLRAGRAVAGGVCSRDRVNFANPPLQCYHPLGFVGELQSSPPEISLAHAIPRSSQREGRGRERREGGSKLHSLSIFSLRGGGGARLHTITHTTRSAQIDNFSHFIPAFVFQISVIYFFARRGFKKRCDDNSAAQGRRGEESGWLEGGEQREEEQGR